MRNVIIIAGVVVLVVIAGGAWFLFRPPQEASGPIEAIPLAEQTPATVADDTDDAAADATDTPAPPATDEPAEPTAAYADDAEATAPPEPTEPAEAEPEATDAPADAPTAEPITYEIVPAQSEARFLIDEVLRGEPITVVGTTDQVAGQVAFTPADPAAAQVGVIQVNARTLATDNDFRNRAIKNAILLTDQHEFVTFTPTEITGMPAATTIGESFSFQMTGDLTVTDVTRPVTFDVTVTPVSETQIEGAAATTILYPDFELFIPDAPPVDALEDEVTLELDFVAQAIE